MKRGEIWMVTLAPRSGSEQRGTRPALIVSSDSFNAAPGWQSLQVVPLSSSGAQARRSHTAVLLPAGTAGLPRDSYALCHQLTTLDRQKFGEHLGQITDDEMKAVERGIVIALDMLFLLKGFQP